MNEPWVIAISGHATGEHAPGLTNDDPAFSNEYQVGHHLLIAHAKAYRLYKREFATSQNGLVGISLNINWFEPLDYTNTSHVEAAETKLQFFGGWFANSIFVDGDYPKCMKEKVGLQNILHSGSKPEN